MPMRETDTLARLAAVIESRKPSAGGDPAVSYVARLLANGPDSFLKKVGEEATEVVLAAKDLDRVAAGDLASHRQSLVGEMADLWFHTLVMLSHLDLNHTDVLNVLDSRMGLSGLAEKAARKRHNADSENA
jgi:phosphoribosyl-ATP pyrophosphohydrolase